MIYYIRTDVEKSTVNAFLVLIRLIVSIATTGFLFTKTKSAEEVSTAVE
jgi:hypothetical protein